MIRIEPRLSYIYYLNQKFVAPVFGQRYFVNTERDIS